MEERKYIKIVSRKGDPVWLSLEKWKDIIESDQTLIPYRLDSEEEWTGRTLNKAEVVYSEYDREYSEKANEIPFKLYRRLSDNVVIKATEGQLPPKLDDYEELG